MLCRSIADMEVVTKMETPCVRSCSLHVFDRQPLCSRPVLQPLFPQSPPSFALPDRDSCGLRAEQIERDFKMSCMSLQIGQTKPVTQALIPAASFSQVLACGHTATRPSRGRLPHMLGRLPHMLAATLPRLQVSAPRALPGARFGWHPEAGVSPALGCAARPFHYRRSIYLLALPVGYPHFGRGGSRGEHQLRYHCGLACAPQRFCRHFSCPGTHRHSGALSVVRNLTIAI